MKWYVYLIIFCSITCVFVIGYSQGWNQAKQVDSILNGYVSESQDFIFLCSDYGHPYYNCPSELQSKNITGNYCNGTLVCQNTLRKDLS